MQTVTLLNLGSTLTAADVADVAAALQIQLARDYAPWYGSFAVKFAATLGAGEWPLYLPDTYAQMPADALGEHLYSGEPIGIVPVQTNIQDGEQWTVSASHELLEMCADPTCNRAYQTRYQGRSCYVAWETCDAVENDAYVINGVYVSNFCLPWWWAPTSITNKATGKPYPTDFLGNLAGKTLTLRPGGYLQYDVPGQGWSEAFDRFVPDSKRTPPAMGRRARRIEIGKRLSGERQSLRGEGR